MDLARTLIADKGLSEPFAVMCALQTAGRGRGGSVWLQAVDPTHAQTLSNEQASEEIIERRDFASAVQTAGVFGPCTFVIPGDRLKIPLNWLSLAVGCALTDALWRARSRAMNLMDFSRVMPTESVCEIRLKWPNDLWAWPYARQSQRTLTSPKKLAGLLCESSFRSDKLQFASIGLGLNVLDAPAHVAQAGSLAQVWGLSSAELTPNRKALLNQLIAEEIQRELFDYLFTERSAEQLRQLTLERSLPLGTPLSVNKGQQNGSFAGLSADGGLLLQGVDEPIRAADVSIPEPFARVCLDFGNSHIHWFTERGDHHVSGQSDWSLYDRKLLGDTRAFAKSELAKNVLASVEGAARVEIVWSAVASASNSLKVVHALETALIEQGSTGREVTLTAIEADAVLQSAGLVADYAHSQMGVDRAIQSWFASRKAQKDGQVVAVLSMGTAFTGVIVSPERRLLESFILPGSAMSLTALHEKTARLPAVSVPQVLPDLSTGAPFTTPVSMLRGVALQARGVIELLIRQHGVQQLILTGGGASACHDILDASAKQIARCEPELVLRAMSEFAATQSHSRAQLQPGLDDEEDGIPEKVLQSMLRARISRRRVQRVTLDRQHFRRLGGRLEHVGVGLRLDRHLGERFKFHTRDVWQQRVEIGEVLVEQNSPKNRTSDEAPANLITVKPTYVLKQGDQIWLFHPPEYEPDMMTNIDVVYDDGDAAVFCKPGNLVVHAAGLYGKNTFIEIAKKMGYGNAAPVHRIDRETSGLLVCARSTPLRRDLSLSFRDSSVKKMYLAVTKGQRPVPSEFRVDLPIGPAINSRIRLKLWHNPHDGLDALTHCVRLAQFEDYSLFACLPQTGRTNQIRVHLAAVGHWIVGDKMYHPDESAFLEFYEEGYTDAVAVKVLLPRHWLHNTGIQFLAHPERGLGREPVIAPLTSDLLGHEPTRSLLKLAGFPLDPAEQKAAFAQLFKKMLSIDFTQSTVLQPMEISHG